LSLIVSLIHLQSETRSEIENKQKEDDTKKEKSKVNRANGSVKKELK
jgi:hypothetical protein